MAADRLLAASDDDLRSCGLSSPKIRTLRAIAAAMEDGALDLAAIERLDAEAAREALTRVKGIGPWSADVYLLFCLGHPDVWPAGDLALQEAARMALGLRSRPDAKRLEKIGERWRPWRAVAARLLWAYYGAVRAPARRGA
jgi:DNA-3-methyladenine glycosylase II